MMAKGEAERYGLGIDLGGTKILAGVINLDTGEVLATAKKKTKTKQGVGELLSRLGDVAEEALATAKLKEGSVTSVGVAAAGQVDPEHGVVIAAPNLGGLANIPIGESLGERLGLPVRLGNDVQHRRWRRIDHQWCAR
jgi:glucokinase